MQSGDSFDIAILGAVPEEINPLVSLLEDGQPSVSLGQRLRTGAWKNLRLLLATTGIGKVNAAAVTASILRGNSIGQVWNIGSAGAYTEGTLRVGDVLITVHSLCGDEGVLESTGISSIERIGIPLATRGAIVIHDRLPLDSTAIARIIRGASPPGNYRMEASGSSRHAHYCGPGRHGPGGWAEGGDPHCPHSAERFDSTGESQTGASPGDTFELQYGPSLTVGMSSGDAKIASMRFHRYGALAENMEGSAVAQTCFLFDVPMAECRGISNVAGNRDRGQWHASTAIDHCVGIVVNWMECFSSRKVP